MFILWHHLILDLVSHFLDLNFLPRTILILYFQVPSFHSRDVFRSCIFHFDIFCSEFSVEILLHCFCVGADLITLAHSESKTLVCVFIKYLLIWSHFKNSFTGTPSRKFTMKPTLKISSYIIKHVATILRKILMSKTVLWGTILVKDEFVTESWHMARSNNVVTETHHSNELHRFWFQGRWISNLCGQISTCRLSFLCEESVLLQYLSFLLRQMCTVSHSVNSSVRLLCNVLLVVQWLWVGPYRRTSQGDRGAATPRLGQTHYFSGKS